MKKTKILSIILISAIISISVLPTAFSQSETTLTYDGTSQAEYENNLNKIHFYLGDPETNVSDGSSTFSLKSKKNTEDYSYIDTQEELYTASDKFNSYYDSNAEPNELIEITVEFKSEYENTTEYKRYLERKDNIKTAEERQIFRKELNSFSKEFHRNENEGNINLLKNMNYENIRIIDYAPFVVLEINKDNIDNEKLINLSECDDIVNISIGLKEKAESCVSWNNTLKEIEAYSTVSSGLLTGNMVKVGVLEAGGVCDTSHSNLSDKNITIDTGTSSKVSDHATKVTSIIALMAPEAEYFVSSNCEQGLSWFIDNDCDIVNCSFSKHTRFSYPEGTYGFVDAEYKHNIDGLFDYHIRTSLITAVVAAGNVETDNTNEDYNPEGQIGSPGLAYNAITVGGLERKLGLFQYYLQHHENSCYKTPYPCAKPEISAIYEVKIPNIAGTVSGTSYAAPQVTGALALASEHYYFSLKSPECLKAMLLASANETEDYNPTYGFYDEKVGAGCLDFYEIRNTEFLGMAPRNNTNSSPDSICPAIQ